MTLNEGTRAISSHTVVAKKQLHSIAVRKNDDCMRLDGLGELNAEIVLEGETVETYLTRQVDVDLVARVEIDGVEAMSRAIDHFQS